MTMRLLSVLFVGTERRARQAARHELREETGYMPGSVQFLSRLNYDGYTSEWRNYFLALDCVPDPNGTQLDENEASSLQLRKVSVATLMDNAFSGRMTDAGAALLAYDKLRQLKDNV